MSKHALRCIVEIDVQAVTCPGVWLPDRSDVFLSVKLFNQIRQTRSSSPVFPLLLHEKFVFDKVFYTAWEPSQVADSLSSGKVVIELIQMSDFYEGGRLLASYIGNAREFLYPGPTFSLCYGSMDRQLLMDRELDFPGIAPRLEFSTRTTLKETSVPHADLRLSLDLGKDFSSTRRSRSKTRSSRGSYKRPTISSATRSKPATTQSKLTTSLQNQLEALTLDDTEGRTAEIRPPFVVRKVGTDLIGRTPSPSRANNADERAKKRYMTKNLGRSYDDMYTYRPVSRPWTPRKSERLDDNYSDLDSEDLEVAELLESPLYTPRVRRRPLTASRYPLYYSSLYDRYDYLPWSLRRSDLITHRVEEALRRNRSLERLRATSPYSLYPLY